MGASIAYICFIGMFLTLLLLTFNKGYKTANRYLGGYLFFASLYLMENYFLLYSHSKSSVAFFTTVHSFFYLIGPFSFFYIRSILRDNTSISKPDYLHFILFIISFTGSIPYLFTDWEYKLLVAQNIQSDQWNTTQFHMNLFLPTKVDQALNVLQIFYYTFFQWRLIGKFQKNRDQKFMHTPQHQLMRKWLFIYCAIFSVIAINFCFAMTNMWLYDDKTIFLSRTNTVLLLASIIYLGLNISLLLFPHIMYGLPVDLLLKRDHEGHILSEEIKIEAKQKPKEEEILKEPSTIQASIELKGNAQMFSAKYISQIEDAIKDIEEKQKYLSPEFKIHSISIDYSIPAHHLSYYFNDIRKEGFSIWRNNLRIHYSLLLMDEGITSAITFEALALQSGFLSQNTFIRSFKNVTGNTPTEYLKSKS